MPLYKFIVTLLLACIFECSIAQSAGVSGKLISEGKAVIAATVSLSSGQHVVKEVGTDSTGFYTIEQLQAGNYLLRVRSEGYAEITKAITIQAGRQITMDFDLSHYGTKLTEVVISGTLKEISRMESPVAVEVFKPAYFKKNPTPNIFEALQNVNGVRPQINCNVCNTGDIHINGLEGPYTMVLIDGMPIVSSLSTVYGLSGIPNSLVERIEIVKGPASSLYGSEAVGGLINIITKKPQQAPLFSADILTTSWKEYNVDLSLKSNAGKKLSFLTGVNYFNFQNKVDRNKDQFTDMTLQDRISVFQKWNVARKYKRVMNLAGRFMYEDRWGGDLRWNKSHRGGDSIYGESIYTKRWEILGNYQLPVKQKMMLSYSYNDHKQNSVYGTTSYRAKQNIAFSQLTWDKRKGKHDLLVGAALRYTYYDDNTPATASTDTIMSDNKPQQTWLPGVFVQDEISLSKKHTCLLSLRYDYHSFHGNIFTPRLAYKWTINPQNIFRLNAGTGFRVVNLFTEDHAALTGARTVEIKNELKPEQSYNVNLNFIKKIYSQDGTFINLDASVFYTWFANRITGDYDTDPNKIVYDNLNGHAESKGFSLNTDITFANGIKLMAGGTLMENTLTENGSTRQQILTENFTGVWAVSYKIKKIHLAIDYTGNVYSPMRLPLLSDLDPRRAKSPWWSIQNIQLMFSGKKNIEIYGGIKNLLNWTPNRGNPFIIARTNDPFDKEVQFGSNGQVISTANNPYALTFDPNYVFGPNQGLRGFLGIRFNVK